MLEKLICIAIICGLFNYTFKVLSDIVKDIVNIFYR